MRLSSIDPRRTPEHSTHDSPFCKNDEGRSFPAFRIATAATEEGPKDASPHFALYETFSPPNVVNEKRLMRILYGRKTKSVSI